MKRSLALSMALLAAIVGTAQLMNFMDPVRMAASPTRLMTSIPVQRELGLDSKQKAEIKKLLDGYTKWLGEASKSSNQDFAAMSGVLKEMEAKEAEFGRQGVALMTPEQAIRYKQVRLQVLGGRALSEPEVQDDLALDDTQKAAVTEYARNETRGLLEAARKGTGAIKAWDKGGEAREAELVKVLSAEQAAKYAALRGKTFKDAKLIRNGR
ncbi:MAG: hypothetical protein M3R13_03610 [Armatimonadota bacterium]|nr:hypothetical protein [Armatimonadota bacterium]